MVINFNPKYIPGDIVYNHKKEIIRITSSYLKGTKLFYYRDGNYGWIREDAIKPIPLTPEILEKNGWKNDGYGCYKLPTKRAYLYITKDTKVNEEFLVCVSLGMHNLASVSFVHELQHLLFGLKINHEMEV